MMIHCTSPLTHAEAMVFLQRNNCKGYMPVPA